MARAQSFARRHAWFMKGDVRKYFDSVPHDRLLAALSGRFKDPFLLAWFARIVGSYEKSPGRGLPIGSLTSQHFANFYLDRLDRLQPGVPYVRYMDDFVFWSDEKATLLDLRRRVSAFMGETLDLELKQELFINRTSLGMDFLGMRVFPASIRLGKAGRLRYRRKLKAYGDAFERGEWGGEAEYQERLTSLTAFTEHADAKAWRRRILAADEEHRGRTVSCAAAAGTIKRSTAAPRTGTGTSLATATGTTASASFVPQHSEESHAVPVRSRFPPSGGTNDNRRPGASSRAERSGTPPFQEETR